eukprot:15323869-Ditylum_brightwellii.AAC.1
MERNHKAATTLQCAWQVYACQKNMSCMVYSARVIQHIVCCLVQSNQYNKTRDLVIGLQSVAQGSLIQRDLQRQDNVACKIQSWQLGVSIQEGHTFIIKSSVVIQPVMRRSRQQEQYVKMYSSVLTLQTWMIMCEARSAYAISRMLLLRYNA